NWGEVAVGWEGCDFDASGKVDTDDASLLIGNWGNDYRDTLSVAAAGQLSQTVVPEPATAGLLSLCSAVLLGRRRRRSGRK
ncbi:MAG: PEP-CTERM sorting domain-containing protein, partial [Phycisphaerae bacterium]